MESITLRTPERRPGGRNAPSYPQEAEIIGRVTGIAQLIAELQSEVSV